MDTQEVKIVKTEKTPVRDLFLRTIAVLGLIAILLLGAWGIIQLAFAIPGVFGDIGASISSLFTHNTTVTSTAPSTNTVKETVTLTMPATLTSGQTLEVSWLHSNADPASQYSYAVSYACQNGLSVKAPVPTGSYEAVPCNTPFNYVNASEHMILVPTLASGSATTPLSVTVIATKLSTGAITASGTATTNILAGAATPPAATTPKPATNTSPSTTYYPAATRATALYGYGDLAVHFTSVSPSPSLTSVQFVIENDGTNVINAGWTFNASLPINGGYTFGSQPQQALYPGDKIAYTLSYNGGTSGSYPYATSAYGYGYGYQTGTITITADPQNYVPEYNKGNNFAQTTVPLY